MKLYSPPPGYYDLPFTYVFDASKLSTTVANPNQYQYIKGGFGDFVLRRVVGLSRLLGSTNPPGTYQLQNRNGYYLASKPIYGGQADDLGIVGEEFYQETGAIKFDLGAITLPTPSQTAQIAFQGVRRVKGVAPQNPSYQAGPRYYVYRLPLIQIPAGVGSVVTTYQTINNYDFELYQLIVLETKATGGSFSITTGSGGATTGLLWINGTSGAVTLDIPVPSASQALSISVTGSTITLNLAANSGGTPQSLISQIINLWNSTGAAAALLSINALGPDLTFAPGGLPISQLIASGGVNVANLQPASGISNLWIYDANKVQIQSAPVFSPFIDGSSLFSPNPPGTHQYGNGAVQTPLWYPQQSVMRVDAVSNLASGQGLVQIYAVGVEYFPC
jgi:hypothetical protein